MKHPTGCSIIHNLHNNRNAIVHKNNREATTTKILKAIIVEAQHHLAHLKHVLGDDVQPLKVVRYTLEVLIAVENHLEYFQDETE